jgi:ATP-binding cassette subfamily B protein
LELPALIKFAMLATVIIGSFVKLVMLFFFVPSAIISGKRINEVFKTKNTIFSNEQVGKKNIMGMVEFRNVSFKFHNAAEYTIKGISFTIAKGQTLAIIGSTGSGKTAIVNLIPRLYDSNEGLISVDGVDIKKYNVRKLRDKIGFIPQKNFLFNASVKENIAYGISDKEDKVDIKKIK